MLFLLVLLIYSLITLFGTVIGPLLLWLNRLQFHTRPAFISSLIAPVLIGTATYAWHAHELAKFVAAAGQLWGLIAKPRPLDYVNYEYSPNGHFYQKWAFGYPLLAEAVLLLIYFTVVPTLARPPRLRIATGAVLYSLGILGIWLALITSAYLDATGFFI